MSTRQTDEAARNFATDGLCHICNTVGAPETVRYCADHHRYFRGDKELISVTTLLRASWPFPADYSKADPAVIANANERGVDTDRLFTSYVRGQLAGFPPGTREDARELFYRLKRFYDKRKFTEVQAQVIVADHAMAGTIDLVADDWIYDLKTVYSIEPKYPVQLGLYAILFMTTFNRPAKGIGIIHCTARFPAPKLIKLDLIECVRDAASIRETYFMAKRRQNGTR